MTELLPNIFAIEVPEDFIHGEIAPMVDSVLLKLTAMNQSTTRHSIVVLPLGPYEIMFTTKGVSEEQAASVVEKLTEQVLSIRHVLGYKAYNNEKIWKNGYLSNYPFRTATASLQSLLKSKGLTAENYLIIKRVEG